MKNRHKREERYRRTLRTAISDNGEAILRCVLSSDTHRLDVMLTEFLLQEAGWTPEEFITRYVNGDFGA